MSVDPTPPQDAYWSEFEVSESDLDFIYNLLLEREKPLTLAQIAEPLVEHHLERLQQEAEAAAAAEFPIYLPEESYQEGQKLAFPAIGGQVGSVVAVRQGENPDLGEFSVIRVEFDEGGEAREFAAQLDDHILNEPPEEETFSEDVDPLEAVLTRYGRAIEDQLAELLEATDDIVRIAFRWFPRPLLADINIGHLNLAEAALDVAGGGPLPTNELIQHIDLPESMDPLLAQFSLDYALQEDERFDEVGPAGEIQWYLKRLEPQQVLETPTRLKYEQRSFTRDKLTDALSQLELDLDDEYSPSTPIDQDIEEVTLPVLFPHWRAGALPLSARLRSLFPTAYEAPRIRFRLIDGHSQEDFAGWVVRKEGYVFGLADWYQRYEVPAGGLIQLKRGEEAGEVIVNAVSRRSRNDWIRTVTIGEEGQVGFTMLKQPVGTSYDELMVVGIVDADALDEAWFNGTQRNMSDDRLITYVFRELAKLNPQSAVHAKSLYSGVNVLRRLPPGPIFAELVGREIYEHVGDLYWRLADNPRSGA
jgi:hypothetical protein